MAFKVSVDCINQLLLESGGGGDGRDELLVNGPPSLPTSLGKMQGKKLVRSS